MISKIKRKIKFKVFRWLEKRYCALLTDLYFEELSRACGYPGYPITPDDIRKLMDDAAV